MEVASSPASEVIVARSEGDLRLPSARERSSERAALSIEEIYRQDAPRFRVLPGLLQLTAVDRPPFLTYGSGAGRAGDVREPSQPSPTALLRLDFVPRPTNQPFGDPHSERPRKSEGRHE